MVALGGGPGSGQDTLDGLGNISGATTVPFANGSVFTATLTGNVTFTFTGAATGVACTMTLYLTQDGTGGRTVTWPAAVTWIGSGATQPTPNTNPGAVNIYTFQTTNTGTTWYGSLAMEFPAAPLTAGIPLLSTAAGGAPVFGGALAPTAVALTDAATILVNAALGNYMTVTLGGNRTMGAPSNPLAGQVLLFELQQDGTGSRTVTWTSGAGGYSFGTGSAPTLTTTINATDQVAFRYSAIVGKWLYQGSEILGFT